MAEKRLTLISNSEEETFEIGKRLGNLLGKRAIICLYGDLGSGKTVFIKGLANALGIPPREIGSASFVLAAQYKTEPPFSHIDLYRIEDIENEDWIWDYIDKGICAIEWAERLGEVPEGSIKVHIKRINENKREVIIEGINKEDWDNL